LTGRQRELPVRPFMALEYKYTILNSQDCVFVFGKERAADLVDKVFYIKRLQFAIAGAFLSIQVKP
jgi:hypothetical protein